MPFSTGLHSVIDRGIEMKLVLKKIQQGPVLAKGEDAAGNSCGYNGVEVDQGCLDLEISRRNGGTVGVEYTAPSYC